MMIHLDNVEKVYRVGVERISALADDRGLRYRHGGGKQFRVAYTRRG